MYISYVLDIISVHFNNTFYITLFRIYFYEGNIFVMGSNDMSEIFLLLRVFFLERVFAATENKRARSRFDKRDSSHYQ